MYLCEILKARMSYHAIIPHCQCLIIWRISDARIVFHSSVPSCWARSELEEVLGLHKFSWGEATRLI